LKFPPEAIAAIKERAVLKKETDLEDCADIYVAIAKNSSMTGQRVAVGKFEFRRDFSSQGD
jgi:hypothetical protein